MSQSERHTSTGIAVSELTQISKPIRSCLNTSLNHTNALTKDEELFTNNCRFHVRQLHDLRMKLGSLCFAIDHLDCAWAHDSRYRKYLTVRVEAEMVTILRGLEKIGADIELVSLAIGRRGSEEELHKQLTVVETSDILTSILHDLTGVQTAIDLFLSAGQIRLLEDVHDLLTQKVQPSGHLSTLESLDQYASKVEFVRQYLQNGAFGAGSPLNTIENLLNAEAANMRQIVRISVAHGKRLVDFISLVAELPSDTLRNITRAAVPLDPSVEGNGAPDDIGASNSGSGPGSGCGPTQVSTTVPHIPMASSGGRSAVPRKNPFDSWRPATATIPSHSVSPSLPQRSGPSNQRLSANEAASLAASYKMQPLWKPDSSGSSDTVPLTERTQRLSSPEPGPLTWNESPRRKEKVTRKGFTLR